MDVDVLIQAKAERAKGLVLGAAVRFEQLWAGTASVLLSRRSALNVSCGLCCLCSDGPNLCLGQGVRMVIRQIGPGMIQQMQTACPQCQYRAERSPRLCALSWIDLIFEHIVTVAFRCD